MALQRIDADKIKRVVVRGTNWVGDAVMTVSAMQALRRILPGAHVTLATRSGPADIFAEADFIDDLIVYDRVGGKLRAPLAQAQVWRQRGFDLALLFQNAFEAAAIAAAARVPVRVGYATQGRRLLLTHPIPMPRWRGERHEVLYYRNIVAELERRLYGASTVAQAAPDFSLSISVERQAAAWELLRSVGAIDVKKLVALCPGSTNSRAKRWPSERYARLADGLLELGTQVVLIGAPDELSVSQEVARLMKQQPLLLTGRTTLAEATAVLGLADLLISNDTGPAHIAAALGCPVLVIFGPTDPRTTRPFQSNAEVVRVAPDCAPCMLRDCPIDHRCMTAIEPEVLLTRAREILG